MWRALKGSRDQRRTGESRVKEKLKKKRERIWWRYGERSKGQMRRTGQSRVAIKKRELFFSFFFF